MIRPLNKMPYAQASVIIYDNGDRKLRSYYTDVIYIEDGWLEVTGLYSATTRRHISAFMDELGLTYQQAKACYEGRYRMNIHTGEILPC